MSKSERKSSAMAHCTRDELVKFVSWLSAIAAVLSVLTAIAVRCWFPDGKAMIGYPILALWVLGPPLWFWTEWVMFSDGFDDRERDRIKHLHDLARNIWIALVVVLAVIFEINWPAG